MTKKLPNGEKLVRAIRRAVKKNPNHVYTAPLGFDHCVYFETKDDGEYCPSCVVGHGFKAIGIDNPNELVAVFTVQYFGVNGESISRVSGDFLNNTGSMNNEEIEIVREWLRRIQRRQDAKWTWVDSIKAANREVPKILELFPYRESEKVYK